jgi:hypothetical protein
MLPLATLLSLIGTAADVVSKLEPIVASVRARGDPHLTSAEDAQVAQHVATLHGSAVSVMQQVMGAKD